MPHATEVFVNARMMTSSAFDVKVRAMARREVREMGTPCDQPGALLRGAQPHAAVAIVACAILALVIGASEARPAGSDAVTISMVVTTSTQPGWQVLIPNFERVYPNIKVNATYVPPGSTISQLVSIELAAGNGPDLVAAAPGCGSPTSICELARAGYLSPLVNEPWAKRSLPLVTSADKYGQGLFAFTPASRPLRGLHERRPVQEARADDPADLLAAPLRLPEGEGRRNRRYPPRRCEPVHNAHREPGRRHGVRKG